MFYALILLVAASRLLPHPPNVACLGALGLFAGCYLVGRRAYLVPLAALFLSDIAGHFLGISGVGFYSPWAMAFVYMGAAAAVPIGRWMRSQSHWSRYPLAAWGSSSVFFLVSNFGVWLAGWYSLSVAGLVACYAAAIPFYGYSLIGDLVFTTILFGVWEWSRQRHRQQVEIESRPGERAPVLVRADEA